MFMIVFRKHVLAGVIIAVEVKLKRISFLSDSARFISQCINTKQMCDIEISLSGFYKSSTKVKIALNPKLDLKQLACRVPHV